MAGAAGTARRARLTASYEAIAAHEQGLADRFLEGIASIPDIRLWGIADRPPG
jgi:selenocysteine lyase/cysteine desulfurase